MYKLLSILLFTFGLAVTIDAVYDNQWALIIGINEYQNEKKLDYATEDAKEIRNLLINHFG